MQETDHVFDGVPVRIYEPAYRTGVLPGFIWFHGGGYMLGSVGNNHVYILGVGVKMDSFSQYDYFSTLLQLNSIASVTASSLN